MNLFPMFLKLEGRRCLVVGAGTVAEAKIHSLLQSGAEITVVAPSVRAEVLSLATNGRIRLIEREFQSSDLENIFLVIAATSSSEINHAVFIDAQQRGILCNAVDDPPNCDFFFPAVVRRGPLQIAVSTAGESPALAQSLRIQIEEQLDDNTGAWLTKVGEVRREVLATLPAGEARKQLLKKLSTREICDHTECPSRKLIDAAIHEKAAQRTSKSKAEPGTV